MASHRTLAIILKTVRYGDFDTIISLFTREKGKIVVIAKAAKKSRKRFSGILELFYNLDIIYDYGKRSSGLPVLKEASLLRPFSLIRSDIIRVTIASSWAETLNMWMQEGLCQPAVYSLFEHLLIKLDRRENDIYILNILFQLKFITLSGFKPNLRSCAECHRELEFFDGKQIYFSLKKGGILCSKCHKKYCDLMPLSKKTVKQLIWIDENSLDIALRMKFSPYSIKESLFFLEAFIPYQLGFEPNSLKFLRKLRSYMIVDKNEYGV